MHSSSLLSRIKRFNEDMARFYAAEIILAVNVLHKYGIVHRYKTTEHTLGERWKLQGSRLWIVQSWSVYMVKDSWCVGLSGIRVWPRRFVSAACMDL